MSFVSGALGALGGSNNVGAAVVKMLLDTTQYEASLAKTKEETVAATNTSAGAFGNFSKAAIAGYATAGLAAFEFVKSAVQAASEHEQVIRALTAQVGSNTAAFEEQATALQNLSGFQDEAILSADTLLSRFKLTQQQVQDTIPTILDLARVLKTDVAGAASVFGKALVGNSRALKQLGIDSSEFVVTGNRAKDAARLVDLLNQKIGGQAAAFADTFAGKMEILSAKFDDIKESIGSGLLDDLAVLADDVNILAGLFDKFGDSLGGATGGLFNMSDALNMPGLQVLSQGLQFLDDKLHLTTEDGYNLTEATAQVEQGLQGMSQEAYDAAAASVTLSKSQQDLVDAVHNAGDGILSLETTVKDTFNVSQKEMDRGFHQMLLTALRFKADMKALDKLDIGLSPSATAKFESFLVSEGPGAVDRFVRSSKAKQQEWVSEFERSIGAVGTKLDQTFGKTYTVHLSTAELDLAQARASRLQQQLDRLS